MYGVNNYEDLTAGSIVTDSTQFDYITLGDMITGVVGGDLNICEAIIYNRKLTTDEYNEVLDYLKQKYNFSNWS